MAEGHRGGKGGGPPQELEHYTTTILHYDYAVAQFQKHGCCSLIDQVCASGDGDKLGITEGDKKCWGAIWVMGGGGLSTQKR